METKKQLKLFTIFEYEKEQDYLREMHRSGWKLVRVRGVGVYHFEKCTPEDVVYQLDYNEDGRAHKDEYVKMFEDCGWEYIQDFAGYSYFRKAVTEDGAPEEIFCDEESRFQMMQRVMRGRMVPLLMIFFAVLLPQFLHQLLEKENMFLSILIGCILVLYLGIFASYLVRYKRYKDSRE